MLNQTNRKLVTANTNFHTLYALDLIKSDDRKHTKIRNCKNSELSTNLYVCGFCEIKLAHFMIFINILVYSHAILLLH